MNSTDTAAPGLSDAVFAGQHRALELALRGAPLSEMLDVLVRTVESQSTTGVLGSVLLLDADGKHLRHGAAPSLPAAYSAAIDGLAIGPSVGSCGTAAFTGKTVIVEDIQSDPLWAEFKDLAGEHGLAACWSAPIFSSSNRVIGTFALYHRTPAVPTARDREVVALLGATAALVLERDRHAAGHAEAEARLQSSEERFSARMMAMFAHAPAGIALLSGPDFVFEVVNDTYARLVGNRPLLGRSVREAIPEAVEQGFIDLLQQVRATGTPFVGRAMRVDLLHEGKVEERYFDFVYQPVPDAGEHPDLVVVAFEVTELVQARMVAERERERAEDNESGLRVFIDNLPELAWTARANGHIDYYNRRWYEYTGTTFEEMEGWGWEKSTTPSCSRS